MFRRILILTFYFLTASRIVFAQSQEYPFSRLDITNGLSNNHINSFYKDKNGFLWVGTFIGLNRYDAYGFKTYQHNNHDTLSLSHDNIIRILEGPGNKMWIETGKGFDVFT